MAQDSDSPQAVPLLDALRDAAALFDTLRIPYALVGGIAAMLYGRARFTEDIDLVAAASHEAVLAANSGVMRQFHFDADATWKLYHASGVSIDIWKDADSDAIASRAVTMEVQGLTIRVAEVHDLVAMKLRAGRPQDDYDITEILRTQKIDDGRMAGLVTPAQLATLAALRARL